MRISDDTFVFDSIEYVYDKEAIEGIEKETGQKFVATTPLVKHEQEKKEPKVKEPLDYGFVRFAKDSKGKWSASISQDLPKPDETLCFAVHVEMYHESVWDKHGIKDIVDRLNGGHISELELELRGRRAAFRMSHGETIDLYFGKGHLPGVKELVEAKGEEATLMEIKEGKSTFSEHLSNGRYGYRRVEPEYTQEQRDRDIQRAIRHNEQKRRAKCEA